MMMMLQNKGSAAAAVPYSTALVNSYGAAEVWPLVNIAGGTAITAKVAAARNGVLSGLTLQNTAGPVTNSLAPLWSGAAPYGNLLTSNGTTGLADIFNGTTGSFFMWVKVAAAGVWTDGAFRRIFKFLADANNYISAYKSSTNGTIDFLYDAGGTVKTVSVSSLSSTGWFSVGMSWDKTAGANGEVKAYIDGAQVGTTQTALGTWVNTGWGTGLALLGANTVGASQNFSGWLAYSAIKFGAVWTAANFAAMHAAATTSTPDP